MRLDWLPIRKGDTPPSTRGTLLALRIPLSFFLNDDDLLLGAGKEDRGEVGHRNVLPPQDSRQRGKEGGPDLVIVDVSRTRRVTDKEEGSLVDQDLLVDVMGDGGAV
jgi:hypothetical protein